MILSRGGGFAVEGLLKRVNESKKISLLMKIYCRFIEIFGAFEFFLLLVFFARKSLLVGASRHTLSARQYYPVRDFCATSL